jgi:hypothetical protein
MSGNSCPNAPKPSSRHWMTYLGLLLALTLVGVVTWLLAAYSHSPLSAVWVVIAGLGWLLYRFGKASIFAVALLWVTAATMLALGLCQPILLGQPWLRIGQFLGTAAFLVFLAAGLSFLIASLKDRAQCVGNCAGFMVVFFSVVIAAASAYNVYCYRRGPETVQETRQMLLTLHRLTMEIEAIHAKTGRYPANEVELVALRGKPMPQYHRLFRISYDRPGPDDYRSRGAYHLQCGTTHFWEDHWDTIFPWIFHFYGADAVQRVCVETF